VKERFSPKYFTKELISDGTYNILALLTAVFQSDEPQFLCIEEPENGLTPDVIKEMVNFSEMLVKKKVIIYGSTPIRNHWCLNSVLMK
jgi:predicted ATPase